MTFWAIQKSTQSRCSIVYINDSCTPGQGYQNCDESDLVAQFEPYNGDNMVEHYSIVAGQLTWNPPDDSAPVNVLVPAPNQTQFLADCASDGTIPGDFGTIGFINLLASLAMNPTALKAQYSKSSSSLSPTVQTAIETHATSNNMAVQ